MSNKEKTASKVLQWNKNIDLVINCTDKNVDLACADKEDVIKESKGQLYKKKFTTNLLKKKLTSLFE